MKFIKTIDNIDSLKYNLINKIKEDFEWALNKLKN